MPDHARGRHLLRRQLPPGRPGPHVVERVHLDRVVVARGRDLAGGVERRVADAQPALVLACQRRQLGGGAGVLAAAQRPQVPEAHGAVQGGGGEEVRVRRVQAEAADLLFGQLEDVGGGGGGAGVGAADVAVEAAEVEDVRGVGV